MDRRKLKKTIITFAIISLICTFIFFLSIRRLESFYACSKYFSHCRAGILYEATTDTVLYEKDADTPYIPASMTKVMTAILALEHNPELKGDLIVNKKAVSGYYCSYIDHPHLVAGETISYYQCVEYMMLQSANEAANALAFDICNGDRDKFVQEMNEKAKELGCEATFYADPHGLSTLNRISCRDMVKISEYAMSFPKMREILTHYNGIVKSNKLRKDDIPYHSLLAPMWADERDDRYQNHYCEYLNGIKTGWIPESGYNYACSMEKDGLKYYAVAMGGEENDCGDGSDRIIQGDFSDVIEVLGMTEGLTANELKNMHDSGIYPYILISVPFAAALFISIKLIGQKKKERDVT